MKRYAAIFLLLALLTPLESAAQRGHGFWHQEWSKDERGDSIALVHILPVYVFSRPVDLRRYRRLVNAVKKVYPLAQTAREEMERMEAELCRLPTAKEQRAYAKSVEKRIKAKYTPVVKKMTRFEGRVLLKLIDRETDYTGYNIIREFRGGFVAGFWQGLAKIFGNDLKLEYDAEGDDRMIEQIVIYYELGWL